MQMRTETYQQTMHFEIVQQMLCKIDGILCGYHSCEVETARVSSDQVQDDYNTSATSPSNQLPLLPILPGTVERVAGAMKAGKEIYLAYANCNPQEKAWRKMKPLTWKRYGEVIMAYCFTHNEEREFNLHRMLRIEDQPWTVEDDPVAGMHLFKMPRVAHTFFCK
jgi:hypothetical protein